MLPALTFVPRLTPLIAVFYAATLLVREWRGNSHWRKCPPWKKAHEKEKKPKNIWSRYTYGGWKSVFSSSQCYGILHVLFASFSHICFFLLHDSKFSFFFQFSCAIFLVRYVSYHLYCFVLECLHKNTIGFDFVISGLNR